MLRALSLVTVLGFGCGTVPCDSFHAEGDVVALPFVGFADGHYLVTWIRSDGQTSARVPEALTIDTAGTHGPVVELPYTGERWNVVSGARHHLVIPDPRYGREILLLAADATAIATVTVPVAEDVWLYEAIAVEDGFLLAYASTGDSYNVVIAKIDFSGSIIVAPTTVATGNRIPHSAGEPVWIARADDTIWVLFLDSNGVVGLRMSTSGAPDQRVIRLAENAFISDVVSLGDRAFVAIRRHNAVMGRVLSKLDPSDIPVTTIRDDQRPIIGLTAFPGAGSLALVATDDGTEAREWLDLDGQTLSSFDLLPGFTRAWSAAGSSGLRVDASTTMGADYSVASLIEARAIEFGVVMGEPTTIATGAQMTVVEMTRCARQ